jgi:HNH endonuclease
MPRTVGECTRCGKVRQFVGRQMCSPCYVRWRYENGTPVACARCGQVRLPFSKGMCKSCYQVLVRYPDASLFGSDTHRARISAAQADGPNRREKSGKWKGGRFIDGEGYVRVLPPDGYQGKRVHGGRYVHEHRLVAEQWLGRLLADGEVVHHRNRDRAENCPANLVVLPSVSAHRRLHVAEAKAGHEVDPRLFGGVPLLGVGREELPLIACVAV